MRSGLDTYLVDRLIELYCAWREECAAVQRAYERLADAEPVDRRLAYAAYGAALDREAAAADIYGAQITRVSSLVTPPEHAGRGAGDPAAAAARPA